MNLNKINKFLERTTGFRFRKVSPRGAVRCAKRIFGNKKIDVIEIGTYKGEHAKKLIKQLNINKLYTIDPYPKDAVGYFKGEVKDAEKIADDLLKNEENIVRIKKSSDDAVNDFKEKVDFIYIDGDHRYEQVKKDLENYYPLVKKGGVFGGHDFINDREHDDVIQAVIEFCVENKLKLQTYYHDWWVIKE